MTEQPVGPRCGNNPNAQLTPEDRKAVDDFKGRLALKEAARPYIDSAVWVDGDPLMEVVAVTVWERCARDDENMPQLVRDDPRTIAAFAAAVARAHGAAPSAPANRAALRERIAAALWAANGPAAAEDVNVDAVLSVLPATTNRADVYREVADRLAADAEKGEKEGFTRIYRRSAAKQVREWAAELRRLAGEAQQPSDRCPHGCDVSICPCLACEAETAAGDETGSEVDACTCAVAGDCFAPAGHYADCPQAAGLPADGAPHTKEADSPRAVCVCGHTRAEHLTVSGRLLCDACDPDSTSNLVCRGFDAL